MRGRSGFSLLEVLVATLLLSLLLGLGWTGVGTAVERSRITAMQSDLLRFAQVQEQQYRQREEYAPPAELLADARFGLSAKVRVDSSAYTPERVYLRVRHLETPTRCSVDYARRSERARNRIRCFGAAEPDVLAPPDAPRAPPADVYHLPVTPPAAAPPAVLPPAPLASLLYAPAVSSPADQWGLPGAVLRQEFLLTNRSTEARRFAFAVASSEPGLVAAPAAPAPRQVGPGQTIGIGFRYTIAGSARAHQAAVLELRAVDMGSPELQARSHFQATAALALAAPALVAPADQVVEPGQTLALVWRVGNRANAARRLRLSASGGSAPALTYGGTSGADGGFGPGEVRDVRTRYTVAPDAEGGLTYSVGLRAADAQHPAHAASASTRLTTRLHLERPAVAAPPAAEERPARPFTRSWRITNRSNAARVFRIALDAGGDAVLSGATGAGEVRVARGGTHVVTGTFVIDDGSAAAARNPLTLRIADRAAPALTAAAASEARTALRLRAPMIELTAPAGAAPGGAVAVRVRVTNRSNAARTLVLARSAGSDAAFATVRGPDGASAGTRTLRLGAHESRAYEFSHQVRPAAAAGALAPIRYAVHDRDDPRLAAKVDHALTIDLVERAPTLEGAHAAHAATAGRSDVDTVVVTNRTNAARTLHIRVLPLDGRRLVADERSPGFVRFGPHERRTVQLSTHVRAGLVAGVGETVRYAVRDSANPRLQAAADHRLTVAELELPPEASWSPLGPSLASGAAGSMTLTIRNRSNAAERICAAGGPSNGALPWRHVLAAPVAADTRCEAFAPGESRAFTYTYRVHAHADAGVARAALSKHVHLQGRPGSGVTRANPISVLNRPPTARMHASPRSAHRGQTVALDATGSRDPEGRPLTCVWTLDDGRGVTGCRATVRYRRLGEYDVRLTVTDPHGARASARERVTVHNRAPRASLSCPADVHSGERWSCSAAVSDPDGDRVFSTWSPAPSGTAGAPGHSQRVCVTATDSYGARTTDCASIRFTNRAPEVRVRCLGSRINIGEILRCSAKALDPDQHDTNGLAVTWNNGSRGSNVLARWNKVGQFRLCSTVFDPHGASGLSCVPVRVVEEICLDRKAKNYRKPGTCIRNLPPTAEYMLAHERRIRIWGSWFRQMSFTEAASDDDGIHGYRWSAYHTIGRVRSITVRGYGKKFSYDAPAEATVTVTLLVVDNSGLQSSRTMSW